MKRFLRENGLSVVFLLLFLISLIGQAVFGWHQYNEDMAEKGISAIPIAEYLSTGHFMQATFENWESEFLQMALFVWFTIFLKQKGSSESKKFDGSDAVDQKISPRKKGAPWPVKKGGIILKLYENSLTIALLLIFVISFGLHFCGSLSDSNLHRSLDGKPLQSAAQYFGSSRFWFESFQNWQSEFLSVFAIVAFSIYLRQKGSPQSKPVDAPHSETGE